ncbi:MAG: ABC transporter permease [Chloroflexi bacterium]|nr:ABC transporter permease [Chloroflexota bacterium]
MTGVAGAVPFRSAASALRLGMRNLFQDRLRFALSVAGVGLSLMLVLFMLGIRAGALRSAVVYLDNAPGTVEVLPPGGRSTAAGSAQFLGPETVAAVAGTPGVEAVTPVLLTMGFSDLHGTKAVIKLVGYDAALGGGPWKLASGRVPAADGEVVLDRVLANRHGLGMGDAFEIGGIQLTIVGLSNETSSWTGSYAFVRKGMVEALLLAPGAASFVLVTPEPGTSRDELMARLRAIDGTNVLLKSDVMANDQEVVAGIFDQVILLMVGAAFVVGALVVGMVIYTATNERRAEYGILKAIGARNAVLYRVVACQALVAAGVGSVVGVGFSYAMGWVVMNARPQFLVVIEPPAIGATLAAGVVMALAGGLFPARAAARLEPAEVFRR